MCGIVACSSDGETVSDKCVEGLTRLQYRGYDSFGFAWSHGGEIARSRSLDCLDEMAPVLPHATAVLGHTRWATHGGVTLANCHPHLAADGAFALVHNGIVENYQALKGKVAQAGRWLESETDTEVIVARMEVHLAAGRGRRAAVLASFAELEGRNTIVVLFSNGEIFGVRHGSPLVLGRAGDCLFLASDVLSFSPWTTTCFALPDHCAVRLDGGSCEAFDGTGAALKIEWVDCEVDREETSLDGYRHHMLKEIMEQWRTVASQAVITDAELAPLVQAVEASESVFITGAGGASYAARQIAWLLREVAGIRAFDVPAYEFESVRHCAVPGDVLIAVSQSGETADTIEAVTAAASWGMKIASLVNMPLSSLARLSAFTFTNRCGPEICVLSTKSASAQLTFGYLLAHAVARKPAVARTGIDSLSRTLSRYLVDAQLDIAHRIGERLSGCEHLFILGKDGYFGSALMGALNIKEASYLHAEAFTAGELKHGVLALIEEGVPVILFVPQVSGYLLNVAAEVKARGAFLIGVACERNELFDAFIPLPPLPAPLQLVSSIVPCQLLAYFIAVSRGLNPDRPRNLAKSVTVK